MRPTRFLLLLIIMFPLLTGLRASALKPPSFSGDSTKFIGELNQLFATLSDNDRKIVEKEMTSFIQNWNSEKFDPAKKKAIYTVGNLMLKNRFLVFPDLYHFICALDAFVSTDQPDEAFLPWTKILATLTASRNSREFPAFLEQTLSFFRSQYIYESSSTIWKVANPVYEFHYDTVPSIRLRKTDLFCYSNRDSLAIYGTQGIYYPLTTVWAGQGGRVDWKRAGLDPGQVYAILHDFRIQLRYSKYTIDSVDFFNRKYLPASLQGKLMDKVQADVNEEQASYPRFYSYEGYMGLPNIFKDIDFYGGFSMEGAKVIGFGTPGRDAQLVFHRDGKEFVVARSKNFVIRPDRINSGSASVSIRWEQDSIYNPSQQLKFLNDIRELSLTKDERITMLSPWFDSYHNIEIYCEAMYWKMNDQQMSFEVMRGPGKEGVAVFESGNYYSLERYEKLRGMDPQNPLNLIRDFSLKINSREFHLDDLVKYMRVPPEQVEGQLLSLSMRGFLIYDQDDKTVVVKDKLIHYVDAKNRKADYDVIFFNSSVEGRSNGLLNLSNFDLRIEGVDRVFLSDSQQVYIYPRGREVVMQKDMNFSFSGKIEAGMFDFYAKDCAFEYDKFRVEMPQIDTMELYTLGKQKDPKTGEYPLVKVKTALNDLSGYLLIDEPDNKSGRKRLPQYPIFTNRDTAHVYYEKKYVWNGVYKKDRFYYDVLPFTIRSLDEMNTDTLRFNGSLTSAGIFPEIAQPLSVRPDYSLGFVKETGPEGMPVYGGKGVFISRIDLSNQGLTGAGQLNYLASVSQSDHFIFFPDSLRAVTKNFTSRELIAEVEYPSVIADSVNQFWLPYADSMNITSIKKDMVMYNNQSTFAGRLSLTPRELSGKGTIKIRDAEMDSEGFRFKQHAFDALIANFRVKSYDLATLSISTKNYRTHFDFDEKRGEFKSNLGISRIEFPFNKYICSMDRFDWSLDNDEIALMNEANQQTQQQETLSLAQLIDVPYSGSEFVSVHPLQDSLRFFAMRATYNLRTNVINAEDVKIIKVADAAIFPDSGKVCILKDAQMQLLKNASVIANTTTKYHYFYNATVSVASRKKYTGDGTYDYVDRTERRQQIPGMALSVDTAGVTNASGSIADSANFRLSPEFGFKGIVSLKAVSKALTFQGGYKAITDCFGTPPQWVRFASEVDPAHVQLPVDAQPRGIAAEKLAVGLLMSNTQNRVYAAFFDSQQSFSDSAMLEASGAVDFDPESSEFRVRPVAGTNGQTPGNQRLSLNTTACSVRAEGKVKLGVNSGNMRMEAFGTLNYFILPDSTNARISFYLDFPFLKEAAEKFRLQLMAVNLQGVTPFATAYATAVNNLLSKDDAPALRTEMEQFGRYRKFPAELTRTIFFADVAMRWDSTSRSWVSYGPIGIASIGDQSVNRYVEGQIEFAKKRNGDDFSFYLKLSAQDWYFFNYRNNILQSISSNLEYNDLIIKAQQDKNEMKRVDHEAKGFRYTISTERKKRDFLRKFEISNE